MMQQVTFMQYDLNQSQTTVNSREMWHQLTTLEASILSKFLTSPITLPKIWSGLVAADAHICWISLYSTTLDNQDSLYLLTLTYFKLQEGDSQALHIQKSKNQISKDINFKDGKANETNNNKNSYSGK